MLYNFTILNDSKKEKQFFLTADNEAQLYRRIISQYGVTKDRVTIVERIEEDGFSYVGAGKKESKKEIKKKNKDKKIIEKCKEIFNNNKKKASKKREEYRDKYKFNEEEINSSEDLYEYVKKYKKVKVYWSPGKERGKHIYYVLYK